MKDIKTFERHSIFSKNALNHLYWSRLAATFAIVCYHLYYSSFFFIDNSTFENLSQSLLIKLFSKGNYGVEVFLFLSGFFNTNEYIKKSNNFSYKDFYKDRFLKLYPPLLIVVLMFFLFYPRNRSFFWIHLLGISNFFPATNQYMDWLWFMSVLFQWYFLAPFFLKIAVKIKYVKTFYSLLIFAILSLKIFQAWKFQIGTDLLLTSTHMNFAAPNLHAAYFEHFYTSLLFRLIPILMGSLFCFQIGRRKKKRPFNLIFLLAIFLPDLLLPLSHFSWIKTLLLPLTPVLFCLGVASLIQIILHIPAARIRSAPRPLLRLCYVTYLINPIIINTFLIHGLWQPSTSKISFLGWSLLSILLTIICAKILLLIISLPIKNQRFCEQAS